MKFETLVEKILREQSVVTIDPSHFDYSDPYWQTPEGRAERADRDQRYNAMIERQSKQPQSQPLQQPRPTYSSNTRSETAVYKPDYKDLPYDSSTQPHPRATVTRTYDPSTGQTRVTRDMDMVVRSPLGLSSDKKVGYARGVPANSPAYSGYLASDPNKATRLYGTPESGMTQRMIAGDEAFARAPQLDPKERESF